MSAICGFFRRDGAPVDSAILSSTLAALAHYGDHPPARWSEGALALGHVLNALSPQDALTPGPLVRGDYVLTADARIDNRAALCRALSIPAALHETISDATLIAMSYARWGADCVDHLIGDFAFVLWDAAAQTLFCARDPVGARPLFYTLTPRLFAFASELAILLEMPEVVTDIDEREIARLLLATPSVSFAQPETTYWRDVYPLTFGCTLRVGAAQAERRRYYDFQPGDTLRLKSLDDYADALYALVETAVTDRLRLRDGVGVGAHCSGGVDSSSIAALAARQHRARGQTPPVFYSWSPPPDPAQPREATEHRRIEPLAAREGVSVRYTDRRYTEPRDDSLLALDVSRYPLNTLVVERTVQPRAAAENIRVMFSGWGGDEGISFNGRGVAAGYLVGGQWRQLNRTLRLTEGWTKPHKLRSAFLRLLNQAVVPALPDPLWNRLVSVRTLSYIHPDLLARTADRRPLPPALRERAGAHRVQRQLFLNGHIAQRMECWAWSGAQHGITYVYPLTDRRILDFALALPPDLWLRDRKARYLYRYTLERLLGHDFVWDTIKQDTALFDRANAARSASEASPVAALSARLADLDCPWVDMARLRADSANPTASGRAEGRPRAAALEALRIWQFRAARK
ncbi:MAG: hypothetical protein JNL42_05245 [Anaerolineae bacterium]|nr:hypothetical protein [Anaerolineae bacterium]